MSKKRKPEPPKVQTSLDLRSQAALVSHDILKCSECEFTSDINEWDCAGADWDEICCPQCNAVLRQPEPWIS